jgi:hypothetical protein
MIPKPQPVGLPAFLPLPYFDYAQHIAAQERRGILAVFR